MRAIWLRSFGLTAVLGGIVGCAANGPNLRTPMPEQYALPPGDDPRFSQPVSYPKETLNTDQVVKPGAGAPKLPPQQPIGPGGGRSGGVGGVGGVGGAPGF